MSHCVCWGYSNLDYVIYQNAVTDTGIDVWASDTDRTFASVLTGPIFSVLYTTLCLFAVYTGRSIFRLCFVRRRSKLNIDTERQIACETED